MQKNTMKTNQNQIDQNLYQGKYDINDLLFAMQQRNLVYNYNFLYFSNKSIESSVIKYNHPDGWLYKDAGSGGQIGLDDVSCRITTSSDDTSIMTFKQALHEFPRWENTLLGKTVTAIAYVSTSAKCEMTISLSDGVKSSSKSIQVGGDYTLDLQLEVDANAKQLYIEIQSSSNSAVINISKIYANLGNIAIENLPCIVNGIIGERNQYIATQNPPVEELSLCNQAIELTINQTRLDSVLNERFGKGSNNLSLLPDIRGYFSRAWNNNADIDPDASTRTMLGEMQTKGDYAGTVEEDVFASHNHELKFSSASIVSAAQGTPATGIDITATSNTQPIGGKETRPKNFAELYTIKWA